MVCWLEQLVGCSCGPPGDYLNAQIPQDPCCQSETVDLGKAWEMCVCVYTRAHVAAHIWGPTVSLRGIFLHWSPPYLLRLGF